MTSPRSAFLLLFLCPIGALAFDIPARPEFGVLDQAGILSLPVLKTAERMISEHERLTQEQLSVLTVSSVSSDDLSGFSTAIFDEWRKTAPRPPNTVLIVVDGAGGGFEVRTGLGLDPILTSVKINFIRDRIFGPEWKVHQKERALVLSFVEVLRTLESPLVAGNETFDATDAFERAGFSGGWTPAVPPEKSWYGWLFAALGIAIAAFVLVRIMIGETHYTADGWFRVSAARNLKRLVPRPRKTPKLVTGGGVSGKY